MRLPISRQTRFSGHSYFGIAALSAALYGLVLAMILGNAGLVYVLMSGYDAALDQSAVLAEMRTGSQRLAVQAMRLSDGGLLQTGQLSKDIDAMDRHLQALDQGGVVGDREIAPLQQAVVRQFLPSIQRHWVGFKGRLQAVILNSYSHGDAQRDPQDLPGGVQRQWLADDAGALLKSVSAASDALMPQLREVKNHVISTLLVAVFVDLALLIFLFWAMRRMVVLPLSELRKGTGAFAHGNYSHRLEPRGVREVAEISTAYNVGVQHIHELIEEMHSNQQGLQRADLVFQGLAANALVGIFLSSHGRFSFVSRKMADIFGYQPDEMVDQLSLLALIAPRERYLVDETLKNALTRKSPTVRFEHRGRRKDGSLIDIEVFLTIIGSGDEASVIGLVQDITESKQAESSAQLAAIAYENSSEAIVITEPTGVIIDVNPAYSKMTGYWPDEVVGELLSLLRPGRHNRDYYDAMWHAINTKGRWEGERWQQRRSGEEYAQRVVLDTAWNHDGTVNCRVVMLSDITQKKQMETAIWNQAHHDPLTGLPNRQYFNEQLLDSVAQSRAKGQTLALLFMDLDLFKEVNDSLGHAMGDRLLVDVAERLRQCAPDGQHFIARLGGDEFVMLLTGAPDRTVMDHLCEQILARITQSYQLAGTATHVSASIGLAFYPADADTAESLMRHVDMAMYAAKAQGRNRYRYFDQSMRNRVQMQHDLLVGLPQALAAGEFFLEYQPIFACDTGQVIQAEALLRWRHPELGVISPLEFIPFAEERKLIQSLGDWVFGEAISQLTRWRSTLATGLRLTINVSPGQFGFVRSGLESVLQQLASAGLPADSLSLEFDERILTHLEHNVRPGLLALHHAGMRFCVGAASLGMPALLASGRLPFEFLKLDPGITEQITNSPVARTVCETIISLAHRLEMSVIAEGITNAAQHQVLKAIGCDAGQGFWLGPPLTASDFEQQYLVHPA
ncbi:MAG: EAL domain-containing protein [Castellaniella sp.]